VRTLVLKKYFDYEAAARQAGISHADLEALRRRVERDYPSRLLRELHLSAICKAIAAGRWTVADALKPGRTQPPPISDLRIGG
jgi:hypothetical protein